MNDKRAQTPDNLVTTEQAAAMLGVTSRRVLALCEHRGVEPWIRTRRVNFWVRGDIEGARAMCGKRAD